MDAQGCLKDKATTRGKRCIEAALLKDVNYKSLTSDLKPTLKTKMELKQDLKITQHV